MIQAKDLFSAEQRNEIERAVSEVEAKTACEILPVVASASGRYDRAEDIFGFWFTLLAVAALWFFFPPAKPDVGSWAESTFFSLFVVMVVMIVSFVLGVCLASQFGSIRKLFTPKKHMQDEVAARARTIFFDQRIHHTDQRVGLLIYVSIYERMAVILGDQTVVDKLGQSELDRLCQFLTQSLRNVDCTTAICRTIHEVGKQLKEPLPMTEGDKNELRNALVVLDSF